ncbi:MAG: NB-ARC domain-containing protein [Pleurocapsa sp. MO_226.B13]|nr:NB-ARC domain-containing protein [Pleurocapsa sp. MO_226.B13]
MSIALEIVVKKIDDLVLAKTGRQLKEVETLVLQGAWSAKTYEQIAENCKYSLGYIKQAAAPRLWKLLSEILEESISKTNFRIAIERRWSNQLEAASVEETEISQTNKVDRKLDWQTIPKINICYGRTEELALLNKWLVDDRCRLVSIVGMGGIGKTTLAVKCVEQVQADFRAIVWRDLRNSISVSELVIDLIQLVSPRQEQDLPENINDRISILLDNLRRHRCLIVLDATTAILQSGSLAGKYREEYQDYGKLFQRLGQESHQSCLMLVAREKPREIAVLEGETHPVRCLTLKGLDAAAKEILKAKKLLDPDKWSELIQLYRGNPLALKIIANTIRDLFGGKVATFLRQQTIVFGELNDLLDEQFECLSSLEIEILYWLAIREYSLSLSQLRSNLIFISSQAKLIEALESLLRRSLIERNLVEEEVMFSLPQPIVKQYIINRICEKICQEIQKVSKSQKLEQLELLRNLSLTENSKQKQITPETKKPLIIQLIVNQLCRIFRDERLVQEQLTKILSLASGETFLVVGHTKKNLERLLEELQFNFENLMINQTVSELTT